MWQDYEAYDRSFNGGGRQNGNWSRGNRGGGYRSGGEQKKRTGCKSGNKNGRQYITGWNYSRSRGMITFIAGPYRNTQEVKSKNGRVWQNWFVKLFNKRTMQEIRTSGMYEVATGRLIMSDLGMIANPKTNYFGSNRRKK